MVESAENALLESIKRKGEHSYYYAHAPRQSDALDSALRMEGSGIIHGGPPKLLVEQELTVPVPHTYVIIRNYSWADEDEDVTIYVNFPENLDSSKVECTFDTKSVELTYCISENETHKLSLKKLNSAIDPASSKYRIRKNRVTITLKKQAGGKWYKLESS